MRRLGVMVAAAAVAFSAVVLLPAGAAGADDAAGIDANDGSDALDVSITRYGGSDRYATSLLIAEAVAAEAGGSLEWVVLVSGERWTDAVVAAPLAGALGAPVLMTPPGELRADALAFLQQTEVSDALVVGPDAGGGAHGPGRGISDTVLTALDGAGVSADRVAGSDRYSTGATAAVRVTAGVMPGLGRTAIVASGEVFADALVAGPFAARGSHPVLLTPPDELHRDVAGYLATNGIEHVVLMGGTAALSETVETAITDLDVSVTRLAGNTRYDTAVKAADLVTDRYTDTAGQTCFATNTIGLARARVPFDSFSAAPLLAELCAPLVLADPAQVPADTAAYLDAAREANPAVDLRVFGGDAAVSQTGINAYLTGQDPAEVGDGAGDGEPDDEVDDDAASGTEPVVLPAGTCGGSIDDEPTQFVPSTNAEDPAWSPDCSQLVYTQDAALWIASNDGTDRRRLIPHGGAYLYSAVWSPQGDRIAYARGRNNDDNQWNAHIWTVDADGSNNNQRTEGDVMDQWPTWSPDGKRIAFERLTGSGRDEDGNRLNTDRHIVVMTSYGNMPQALNAEGPWEQSPAWSPDGTQLAFQSNGYLLLSDIDGSDMRRINVGVSFDGGLSWSPDGNRIAFVRGGGAQTTVVIADVDGLDEEVVFDEGIRTLAPRWSPDGQRLAFHTIDADGKHFTYVSGASGEPDAPAADCRPRGVSGITAGFPRPDQAPSVGTARIGVLFMDFPDAQASHSTEEEAELGLPWAEQYLEAASYGRLDIEFVPLHRWLRAEQDSAAYIGPSPIGEGLVSGASAHAVALADDEVDFSTLDLVLTVFPGSHFGGGNALGWATADEVGITTTRVNTDPLEEAGSPGEWGYTGAHEIAHNLGLLDMYPYDFDLHALPESTEESVWVFVDMGLMGLRAQFRTMADDSRFGTEWIFPDGSTGTGFSFSAAVREMLGWSRWQLDWLDAEQVHCDSGSGVTVSLAPIAQPGDAVALAVVPRNSHEMIVIESRRAVGNDTGQDWVDPNSGASTTFPGLVTEGVLVYTVDTFIGSGELPVKVAGDSGNSQVDDFPVLEVGDSVTLWGYTITVTGDDGDTHTVSITRDE